LEFHGEIERNGDRNDDRLRDKEIKNELLIKGGKEINVRNGQWKKREREKKLI
jgi:hypothetical protein